MTTLSIIGTIQMTIIVSTMVLPAIIVLGIILLKSKKEKIG